MRLGVASVNPSVVPYGQAPDNINALNIRNFSIIAHIDHGKSTLADRFLEITRTLRPEEISEQVLDSMDLERERGITIKMHPVRMEYTYRGETYILNLIDTPGHVDFSYEVSRSLAACEGALLLIDATQGVEAQTIANLYLALEQDLVILPVINKIDLPNADVDRVKQQIYDLLGPEEEVYLVSAKEGWGVEELLQAIIEKIPPPKGDPQKPLQALVFDAVFDEYRGAIPFVRIFEGTVKPGDRIRFKSTGLTYEVTEVGYFKPHRVPAPRLVAGEVGYIAAGIKDIRQARVGDTIVLARFPETPALPGYREPKPMVFAGFYPLLPSEFPELQKALDKLRLNDSAIVYQQEYSPALGPGFRVGFLGLLHMEIVRERLRREFGLEVIVTTPNVEYKVILRDGTERVVTSPKDFPDVFEKALEPYVLVQIITPQEYIGAVVELCQKKRGVQRTFQYLDPRTVLFEYEMPLREVIFDFYDRLKTVTRGYASMDYEFLEFRESDLVRLDIYVAGERVESLAQVVHREDAYRIGREITEKLRKMIPRHLFEVTIQAAIGKRVIAKQRIAPLRKDVTAKCYGGDVTRKRKLLEKQKEGKKRMKKVGRVDLPQEAFMVVLTKEPEGRKKK